VLFGPNDGVQIQSGRVLTIRYGPAQGLSHGPHVVGSSPAAATDVVYALLPGLQEAAAERFDRILEVIVSEAEEKCDVSKRGGTR
jgi:hypothetical protein